jgi:hypothetical protein
MMHAPSRVAAERLVRIGSAGAGVAAALFLLELGLRILSSPEQIPPPNIHVDSLHLPAVARRQLEEGVAVAHFSTAGARLTGNPPIGRDVTVVILGDSYVVARAVGDDETMGARLERAARGSGVPLDVRQYGWSGASAAQYLLVAKETLARWHPRRVMIVLDDNNFNMNALINTWPKLRVDDQGNARVVGTPADTLEARASPSSLWLLAAHRWVTLSQSAPSWARFRTRTPGDVPPVAAGVSVPPNVAELAALPGAVVRALAKAYGERLTIVFIARVGLSTATDPTEQETRLFAACRVARVSCISTRGDMLRARRDGIIGFGPSTKEIGAGHLNSRGHAVLAETMWNVLGADATITGGPRAR